MAEALANGSVADSLMALLFALGGALIMLALLHMEKWLKPAAPSNPVADVKE
mgnify:CR=1 FL=1